MIVDSANCPPIDAPKVFLEIGCAYSTVPGYGAYEFGEDEQYVGINIRRNALEQAEAELQGAHTKSLAKEPILVHGDATALPPQIGDESVDTVYFGNVFGDPGIDVGHIRALERERFLEYERRAWGWDGRFYPGVKEEPIRPRDHITLPAMLRAAHRVIKRSGKLVVLETLTPYMDRHMTEFMDDAGFKVDAHIYQTSETMEAWSEAVRPFKKFEAKRVPEDRRTDLRNYITFASKLALAQLA